jgi:hypothetical protein
MDRRRPRCWRWTAFPEREAAFVKDDVPRRDDASCDQIEAPIAPVVRRIAEEDASCGAWTELVRRRGTEVGVAEASENAKLIVSWRCAQEEVMGRQVAGGATGATVQQERRRVQGLRPVRRRSCTLNQQGSQTIVNRAQHAFRLAVLLGRIRAREAEGDAVVGEEGARGSRVEFAAVVSLERNNW